MCCYQDKTTEEHKKMVEGIVKRDEKRRKRIKAAGIDYECPALVSKPLRAVNLFSGIPLIIYTKFGAFMFLNNMCNYR
jgi:hypothetical protein